ncbi:MAG: C-GCAxxG-C-C family protein [Candidatus Hodarchaeota archaeon]
MDKKKQLFQDVTRRDFFTKTALTTAFALGGFAILPSEITWGKTELTTKAKAREGYRGLSRQELLDKAYAQGANYEQNSTSCSQCTVAGLHEILDIDDVVVKVATSSCGGQAGMGMGTCGALIGGTMVLDYFFGRPSEGMSDKASKKADFKTLGNALGVAKLLYDKYVKEYGTILCPAIQQQLFGRHYFLLDPDDQEKFEKAGGHSDPSKCIHIVGNAARWTMEILLNKDVVEV